MFSFPNVVSFDSVDVTYRCAHHIYVKAPFQGALTLVQIIRNVDHVVDLHISQSFHHFVVLSAGNPSEAGQNFSKFGINNCRTTWKRLVIVMEPPSMRTLVRKKIVTVDIFLRRKSRLSNDSLDEIEPSHQEYHRISSKGMP